MTDTRTAEQLADHLNEIGRIGGDSRFRHIDDLWDYIEALPEVDTEATWDLHPDGFVTRDGHVVRDVTYSANLQREIASWTGDPDPGRTYWQVATADESGAR